MLQGIGLINHGVALSLRVADDEVADWQWKQWKQWNTQAFLHTDCVIWKVMANLSTVLTYFTFELAFKP